LLVFACCLDFLAYVILHEIPFFIVSKDAVHQFLSVHDCQGSEVTVKLFQVVRQVEVVLVLRAWVLFGPLDFNNEHRHVLIAGEAAIDDEVRFYLLAVEV